MMSTQPSAKYTPTTTKSLNRGVQHIYKFPNGFSASVIQNPYSYGGDRGLWELAVLDSDGDLSYDTPVTGDVEGYLKPDAVDVLLDQIAGLDAQS